MSQPVAVSRVSLWATWRFYGWVVVIAAWLTMFVSSVANMNLTFFIPEFQDEFGWSLGSIVFVRSISAWLGGPFSLTAGRLVEQWGPRKAILRGALVSGVALALMGLIRQRWQFYLLLGAIAPFGQAMAQRIAPVTTVRRWFMRRAGLAASLAWTGTGLGMVIGGPLVFWLISTFGWRWTFLSMAILLLSGASLGALLIRRDPESSGTYPDGIPVTPEEIRSRQDFRARSERWSLREAARVPTFWLYAIAQTGSGTISGVIMINMVPWVTQGLGFSKGVATATYSIFIFSAVVGRLVAGPASDFLMSRFGTSRKPLLYFANMGVTLSMFLALLVTDRMSLTLVLILTGFTYGHGLVLYPTYLGDLFGVVSLPSLMGLGTIGVEGITGLLPWLFASLFDWTGTFDFSFIMLGFYALFTVVCLALIRPPKRRSTVSG